MGKALLDYGETENLRKRTESPGFLAQGVISIGKKQCHFFWRRGSMRKEDAFFSRKNIFSLFSIFM